MILYKKSAIILIFTLFFSLLYNKSNAQLSLKQNFNEPISLTTSLTENDFTKPKPSFRKRRLGMHTFSLEGGYFYGYYKGLRYSINYDILLQSGLKDALTFRIGAGLNKGVNGTTIKTDEVFFPFGIYILLGNINLLEIGLGGYYFENRRALNPFASIGFRHQKPRGGFMYRVAFDLHLERSYDLQGRNTSKTGVFGPLIGIGWTF